jgi:soluble lytic murein transglycosylase-like protein
MRLNPRNLIIPAVLASSICMALLSITVNSGYAQPSALPNTNLKAESQISTAQLSSQFPESIQQWKIIIETSAADSGLDPNLIAAVMLQESGGNPQAYSSSGAVGLLQVMPKDGIASEFMCGGLPCFINRPTINELLEPQFNIQYGSRYIAKLIQQKGSKREALRVYGPMDIGYGYADIVLAIYENYR